ncbi:hypothetical protein DB313_05360 (plasmid) [Borrelia turcica IST7]|uniref:Uncharacterized protein n=1 Tax=Borrelia turcica IST7 TaxID=1104446 RepID=A0A386PNW1_9SPIR|nr:hypothetical protein [Borrelia turcica]AYE36928.1 hypothetical protein DB313_05360 [Borrelia turcica IST7]
MYDWLYKSSINPKITNQHKIMRGTAFNFFKECMIIAIDSFNTNGKLFNIKELKYEFRKVLTNREYNVASNGVIVKDFFDHFTDLDKKSEVKLKGIETTQFHSQDTIENKIIPDEVARLNQLLNFKNKDTIKENSQILTFLLKKILLSKSKVVLLDLFQFDFLKSKFPHLSKQRHKSIIDILNRNIVLIKEKIKLTD